MTAQQITFVRGCLPAALAAGAVFNMNPTVILAQAAFESGWGSSTLCTGSRNFFGLTAYGCSNAYWHGGKTTVKAADYVLDFRRYDTVQNSFLDFARLIRNNYRRAWLLSNDPDAYAKEIAYSPYISELNGDDREAYHHSIASICRTVQAIVALIGDTAPADMHTPGTGGHTPGTGGHTPGTGGQTPPLLTHVTY